LFVLSLSLADSFQICTSQVELWSADGWTDPHVRLPGADTKEAPLHPSGVRGIESSFLWKEMLHFPRETRQSFTWDIKQLQYGEGDHWASCAAPSSHGGQIPSCGAPRDSRTSHPLQQLLGIGYWAGKCGTHWTAKDSRKGFIIKSAFEIDW
jgi:hypothetical protein